jgi:hypothetical protein
MIEEIIEKRSKTDRKPEKGAQETQNILLVQNYFDETIQFPGISFEHFRDSLSEKNLLASICSSSVSGTFW